MLLLLQHPAIARLSCSFCQKWQHNDGKVLERGGKPVRRPIGMPTPCGSCPKKSPEESRGLERDLPRIRRALQLYYESKAGTLPTSWRRDSILRQHLGIIERLVSRYQQSELVTTLCQIYGGGK